MIFHNFKFKTINNEIYNSYPLPDTGISTPDTG